MVRGHAQLTPSHDRGQTVTWRAAPKSAALTVEAADMVETPTMPVTVSAALVSADFIVFSARWSAREVSTPRVASA
jgi:hypothetical protein